MTDLFDSAPAPVTMRAAPEITKRPRLQNIAAPILTEAAPETIAQAPQVQPETKPAPVELAPLPTFSTPTEALAAIVAAFDDDTKPIFYKGFRIVRSDLADAIEAARAMLAS